MPTDQKDDAYRVKDMTGPWLPCLPAFCNMPLFTLIFAALGVLVGALLAESDIHTTAEACYGGATATKVYYSEITADMVQGNVDFPITIDAKSRNDAPGKKSCWLVLFKWPGALWVRGLKCLVSPLLACMMLLLPTKLGELGGVGIRVACLLLFTSTFAAIEGLIWVNIIQPGSIIDKSDQDLRPGKFYTSYISWFESLLNIVQNAIPLNIIDEMANLRVLGIITFFLIFGYYLRVDCPKQWSDPILNAGRGFLRCTMNYLRILMWFTPIAMFSLVASNLMGISDLSSVFKAVGLYVLTQLLGQFFHLVLFYFLFYFLMTRRNPLSFFAQIYEAPMTALATSSSAATLPVTLRVNLAEKNSGDEEADKRGRAVVNFVVPLGAAINMDGTSLGFPVMVVFVSQVGVALGMHDGINVGDMIVVAILSMVCSLGTAPIPNAGMVYLTMLLEAGSIKDSTLQGFGIALITLFDWLVDRVETAQNVTSDSFISSIISNMKIGQSVSAESGMEMQKTADQI